MKWRLLLGMVITLYSLAACQTTQLSASVIHQPQSITSLVAEKADQPDLYFDQNGQYSSTPVKGKFYQSGAVEEYCGCAPAVEEGGFYRKVLGKTQDGSWVVQDFYQDSETKQTDPFVIFRTDGLRDFSNDVVNSLVIWYRPDGTREASVHFVRGKPTGNALTYDKQGYVRAVTKLNAGGEAQSVRCYNKVGTLIVDSDSIKEKKRFWYGNGKPAAIREKNGFTAWAPDGSVLSGEQSELLFLYLNSLPLSYDQGDEVNYCPVE